MTYNKVLPTTTLTHSQFIGEMNKALASLSYYRDGMAVCGDDSGYWLEIDGVKDVGNEDLLASARMLVVGD